MKTTVELPDALFHAVKRAAAQRKTTVKALIEQGLRAVVSERSAGFSLRRASFKGNGLVDGRSLEHWATVRDLIYDDRRQ